MRSWLIGMLLLSAALAGCSEEPSTPDDTGDDGTGDDGTGDDGNGTVAPENNTAPVANLTADVQNGTAPLFVNLTLEGSDADGDNLTWILALGGNETANGTVLPATLNFTLDVGNHTFALTVSDGNLTHSADLTIEVAAPAAPEEDPNAPIDKGTFMYDPVTKMCHLKVYDAYGQGPATIYNFGYWIFAETNGEPGLQVANNFLVGPLEDEGFALAEWDICEDGDQMVF